MITESIKAISKKGIERTLSIIQETAAKMSIKKEEFAAVAISVNTLLPPRSCGQGDVINAFVDAKMVLEDSRFGQNVSEISKSAILIDPYSETVVGAVGINGPEPGLIEELVQKAKIAIEQAMTNQVY